MIFQNKKVLIVGGSGGIGQLLTKAFENEGAYVIATYNKQSLTVPSAQSIKMDVRSDFEVKTRLEMVGQVDIVVYAAAIFENIKIRDGGIGNWNRVIQTNLSGAMSVLRYAQLVPGGKVVLLGSVVGETGGYGCASYAASKAGLVGLCKAYANENKDIFANVLELGYFEIGMGDTFDSAMKEKIAKTIPLGKFGKPEEIVKAVFFLADTEYMTGNVLKLAGGL